MALSDYLASKYLSADSSKPGKKRKRRHAEETAGLQIADDDADAWTDPTNGRDGDDDGEDDPLIVSADDPSQINKRTATWKTIGSLAPSNAEQEAADAILASAERERATREQATADEDAPAIAGTTDDADYGLDTGANDSNRAAAAAAGGGAPQMASGAMAGLQTAAQITASLEKRQRAERKAMEAQGLDPSGKASETIYRDASGRIINVAMKRAELRRKAEEDELNRVRDQQSRTGDVQIREKQAARDRLEGAKYLGVARYADDEELNGELKQKERWNDPAARFVASTKGGSTSRKGKASRKKMYEGPSEPNRYGIKPGFRWDGVDRSNGFERKWFNARNQKANVRDLEYAWEMDE